MVGMWSLFREIDQSKTTWAIKARAIRVYREPAHDCFPESLEVVFHDEEGSRMHAHIPDQFINKFIGIFKEGRVFAVKNFMVEENYMFFKTSTSAYRLCFFNKSAAFEIRGVPFPIRTFSLVSFASLQAQDNLDEKYGIDVIGQVVHDKDPKTILKNDRPRKLMEMVLGDPEGNVMACTLWGPMVEMLLTYKLTTSEPIVMLLQCCKARKYQGHVHVSNMFNTTKVILNGSEEEFVEFKSRMAERSSKGLRFSITTDNSDNSDIATGQQDLITIEALTKLQEDGKYWVYGEIVAIDSHKDWSYISCIGCNRKVSPNGDSFCCVSCNSNDVVLRYKVNVRVVDGTTHASFLLWDREVSCLLGKSAASLKEQVSRRNYGPHYFPSEINSLIDIKALFKVQFKRESRSFKGNQTFSVIRMNTDARVLALYSSKINAVEEEDEEDEFTRLAKEFSGPESMALSSQQSVSSPLLTKEKRHALDVDTDKLRRDLFGEFEASTSTKKPRGVKRE
ncbi:unnamed protein product [Cuscuta epithymum]|uniref:Replication factor A C-terminal domain-containing protein n=1 Tax=Cuscuta epithymum TaxID=186058 RepID=A0AAV0FG77_9ASTE|nr:unnamed protein product [Cuscuta epithymum]